jgi:hypothetical protein
MTGFLVPELEHICQAIQDLIDNYKETTGYIFGTRAIRPLQIGMLKSLKNQAASMENGHEIIVGACVYIFAATGAEWTMSSQLYTFAQKALRIDEESNKDKAEKNVLDHESRFIYLSVFLTHLQKTACNPTLYSSAFAITEQAKTNLIPKMTTLCNRLPTTRALRENFRNLPHYYEEKCANDSFISTLLSYLWIGGRNPQRKEAIRFIKILDERCSQLSNNELEEKPKDYFIRFGALIKIMYDIEQSCYLRPKSELYQEACRITNLNSTSDLCFELKEEDLSALDSMICQDVVTPHELEFWKKNNVNKLTLDTIKDDIVTMRAAYVKEKKGVLTTSPAFNKLVNDSAECLTTTITRSGVVFAVVELAGLLVSTNVGVEAILAAASPANALILMGCLWAIKTIRSSASAMLVNVCAPYIAPIVTLPFKKAFSHHPFFSNSAATSKVTAEDFMLITALYNSPVCSQDEKRKFALLFDLEQPEPLRLTDQTQKLSPRSQPSASSTNL